MSGWENDPVIARVRRSLGRTVPPRSLPVPPRIDEPTVRLVHADIGLAELFVASAAAAEIRADLIHADELAEKLVSDLRRAGVGTASLDPSPLLTNLGVGDALLKAGIGMASDAGESQIAVPYAAVAETGTLAFRGGPDRAAASRLFVIVEPRHLVADLLDLFEKLSDDDAVVSTLLLSGSRPAMRVYVLH